MVKILHIIPNLRRGGAERLVLDICSELLKRPEVDVRLVCFSNQNEYPDYLDRVKPVVIKSSIKLSLFHKNEFQIEALQKYVDEFGPDVIHTHLFEAEIISRFINYPDAKWFSHCHDNMVQFRKFGPASLLSKQNLTNYFEKKFLFWNYKKNGGTHFIAISKYTQAYLKKTAKPYPVTLLPNAIDYQKFFNKTPGKKEINLLRLINIGSFVEKKNQAFLIEVAGILKKKSILFKLQLLGDGVKKPELENRSRKLGLNKEVVFQGLVEKVEDLLWQSDIYVHSATYESLGLVLLEAMAAGLPVITLDGKGNRDLILQGKNGFMLFEENPVKFADKILEVWEDKGKYQEMSGYAQAFARQYDIKAYVDRLLEIYRKAL